MQVQLRHNPSFTVARCLLAPGEPLRVEGGAIGTGTHSREGIGGIAGGLFGG